MQKEDVLLARQPIYDVNKQLYGYEILFRDNEDNQATINCDISATSTVLLNLFTDADLEHVTGNLPAFVNFSADLLQDDPIFEPDTVVIEILEHTEIDDALIARINELRAMNYRVALDDISNVENIKTVLPYTDIVKVELPAYTEDQLREAVAFLKRYDVTILAEKVETQEEFKLCVELGFDLFQGFFLAKPEIVRGQKLNINKLGVLKLLAELQDPEADVVKITDVISQDPLISYKLLRLINSAAYRRPNEIDSIRSAVSLLGVNRIRSWASMLALSKLETKPDALKYVAQVRALTCEKLAEKMLPGQQSEFYTMGLFSCLDAFFDLPLEEVLGQIPLKEEIKQALNHHSGLHGLIITSTLLYEQALLDQIDWAALSEHGVEAHDLNEIYYQCSALALETEG